MEFAPDATWEERLNGWISHAGSGINSIIEKFSDKSDTKYFHIFSSLRSNFDNLLKITNSKMDLIGSNIMPLANIFEGLSNRANEIINTPDNLNIPLDKIIELANILDTEYPKYINSVSYEIKDNVSNDEFKRIINEISIVIPTINEFINLEVFNNSNLPQKETISRNIIRIRNEISKGKYENTTVNYLLDELKSISDIVNLRSQIEEIKDSHSILLKVKENTAKENTAKLNTGYESAASKLSEKIDSLNNNIVILFTVIIISIAIKTILVLIDMENIKDLYSFFVFISLIISCSALTTYLIKERNRLIKLHDHYQMNVLELSTLPEYMRELDSNQRQTLIINLSNNYFRGSNNNLSDSNLENNKINEITSTLENLTKLIKEIKDTTK